MYYKHQGGAAQQYDDWGVERNHVQSRNCIFGVANDVLWREDACLFAHCSARLERAFHCMMRGTVSDAELGWSTV